jgi:hypothetical protein
MCRGACRSKRQSDVNASSECVLRAMKIGREVHRQLAVAVGHSYFRPSGVERQVDTSAALFSDLA